MGGAMVSCLIELPVFTPVEAGKLRPVSPMGFLELTADVMLRHILPKKSSIDLSEFFLKVTKRHCKNVNIKTVNKIKNKMRTPY